MPFDPQLTKGQIFNNKDLLCIFQCGPQGMRRSLKTNSLVVVSDHTKGFYKDRREDNILCCTGMGLTGDQSLDAAQNKALAKSNTNGIAVFLFEVFEEGINPSSAVCLHDGSKTSVFWFTQTPLM